MSYFFAQKFPHFIGCSKCGQIVERDPPMAAAKASYAYQSYVARRRAG